MNKQWLWNLLTIVLLVVGLGVWIWLPWQGVLGVAVALALWLFLTRSGRLSRPPRGGAAHEKSDALVQCVALMGLDRPTCVRRILALGSLHQLASACSARAVISSTLPVPLMTRYLGATAGSALAQLL